MFLPRRRVAARRVPSIGRSLGLAGFLALAALRPCPASSLDIKIVPGPSVMTPEEKAIQADPAKGIQDGVILVDEGEITENLGMNTDYTYHFRAKILSNQARELANVEMPWNMEESGLYEWWGRTILPNGTVLELSKEEFVEQTVMKRGKQEERVLRGALPGVVPGCVIDYGYDYLGLFGVNGLKIPLTRPWPVREFRFRWKFPQRAWGNYSLHKAPGADIQVVRDNKSILVTGHNLAPVVVEPFMPPREKQESYVMLGYYAGIGPGEVVENKLPPPDNTDSSKVPTNVSDTHVTINFIENNAKVLFEWIRDGSGEVGREERTALKEMSPADRRRRMDELCGGTDAQELNRAAAPGYNELDKPYRTECSATMDSAIDGDVRTYHLTVQGPWFEEIPGLTAPERVLPVVFPFPRTDLCTLNVHPPAGFTAGAAPAPVSISSAFGTYELITTVTAQGTFHLERRLTLLPRHVPVNDYQDLRHFLAQARRADKTRLAFRREGAPHE